MEIVVNDTNIFIDLHSIRLLDQFFELPITVHTVDFVINELTDEVQFKAINKYIENGKLKVQSFEADMPRGSVMRLQLENFLRRKL
ncbi:MAG: hypothetical protein ACI4T0_03745, partial [Candidatus Limisoma sp.]